MPLQSFAFVLVFLPVVLLVHGLLASRGLGQARRLWLTAASLAFFAYGSLAALPLLLLSVLANFWFGRAVAVGPAARRKRVLVVGLLFNVGLLCSFKYVGFLAGIVNSAAGTHFEPTAMQLPLGLSFFTLQQIMYLVDCYEELATPNGPLGHLLFVTFFPGITAGPIARAKDTVAGQNDPSPKLDFDALARNLTLFSMGLFKKVVFADSFARWADAGFAPVPGSVVTGWIAALCFAFQIYFDFSGYSDMALAIAGMLGVSLPVNFKSPYKSLTITDFWRRWHITLSNFITTYLYTPLIRSLGYATLGKAVFITLVVMTIAGLWHGPAWTYVVFGALHGAALGVAQVWKKAKLRLPNPVAWAATFLFVVLAFVVFRAPSLEVAGQALHVMFGGAPVMKFDEYSAISSMEKAQALLLCLIGIIVTFAGRNSMELLERFTPSRRWVVAVSFLMVASLVFMNAAKVKEFLYRDF